jgi:hypothetical protein
LHVVLKSSVGSMKPTWAGADLAQVLACALCSRWHPGAEYPAQTNYLYLTYLRCTRIGFAMSGAGVCWVRGLSYWQLGGVRLVQCQCAADHT